MATGHWIAVIDDDELPSQQWLQRMVQTASEHDAQGPMGPVIPVVPTSAEEWVRSGRYHDRPRFATGSVVPRSQFRTSNALCAAEWLRRIEGPFDPRYGLTGASDSHLFNLLANLGARFVWCDEAEVEEFVGTERLKLRWLLMRRFRGGADFARLTISGAYGPVRPWTILLLVVRAFVQMIVSALVTLVAVPLGRRRSIPWLLRGFSNLGKLAGVLGVRYREYA